MTKTALITGTSSGFGESLVHAFARAGWNVTATMRTPAKAPAGFADLPNVLVERLDVTDDTSIRSALAASEARFGPTDVLLNVAAVVQRGSLEEHSIDQIRHEFETNVFGLLALTKAVLPGMRGRGRGHIINFSSAAGVMGMPGNAAYAASKFAVEGYSEALAYDMEHLGVRVTIVEPGVFRTELGSNAVPPETPLKTYANSPAAATLRQVFDFSPGNIDAASDAIVSVAGEPDAPLRLYVGHGLDGVRRRHQERLDTWAAWEHVTRATL